MSTSAVTKVVSVIMPVYNQAPFITRAVQSLMAQTFQNWELVLINDGSSDRLGGIISEYLTDSRIHYIQNKANTGLGACLNKGIHMASGAYISYLPADDVYYQDHLEQLLQVFKDTNTILAYSGVRHHYNRQATGQIEGYPLQLVQVMHRKTNDRWIERDELVTDDLERMFWSGLRKKGNFAGTNELTCEWVDHPRQRHKIIQEPIGGINPYKEYYGVKQPLRFHSSVGNFIDEVSYYKPFREKINEWYQQRTQNCDGGRIGV